MQAVWLSAKSRAWREGDELQVKNNQLNPTKPHPDLKRSFARVRDSGWIWRRSTLPSYISESDTGMKPLRLQNLLFIKDLLEKKMVIFIWVGKLMWTSRWCPANTETRSSHSSLCWFSYPESIAQWGQHLFCEQEIMMKKGQAALVWEVELSPGFWLPLPGTFPMPTNLSKANWTAYFGGMMLKVISLTQRCADREAALTVRFIMLQSYLIWREVTWRWTQLCSREEAGGDMRQQPEILAVILWTYWVQAAVGMMLALRFRKASCWCNRW